MEISINEQCDRCGQPRKTVGITLRRWGPQDFEVYLCEECLTKAMLLVRPFSVIPKPTAPTPPTKPRPSVGLES